MGYDGVMKIRVLNPERFEAEVFGGWAFLHNWPHITTTGVEVVKRSHPDMGELHYMVTPEGNPVDHPWSFNVSTCFFSAEEMALDCLEVIP